MSVYRCTVVVLGHRCIRKDKHDGECIFPNKWHPPSYGAVVTKIPTASPTIDAVLYWNKYKRENSSEFNRVLDLLLFHIDLHREEQLRAMEASTIYITSKEVL